MKRISLAAALAATSLFAATDGQIIEYFKGQVPENISVTITERQELQGTEPKAK